MSENSLKETIREDGLRIITKKINHTKRVRVAVIALVGSAHDPQNKKGLAHFFEHMAFKGTRTRSVSDLSSFSESHLLEFNAMTSVLNTMYLGEAVYTSFQKLLDFIFDIYLNPIFPQIEIGREREVILNELSISNDNDEYKSYYAFLDILLKKNPLRKPILGSQKSIESIDRKSFLKMHKKWYIPSNTVIIGTGRIEHDLLVEKAFREFPLNFKTVEHMAWDNECWQPSRKKEVVIKRLNREKATIVFGCKAEFFSEKEEAAMIILGRMLGGGINSMLFQEIREKLGFAYSVYGQFFGIHQLGAYFYFLAETLQKRVREVKQLMPDIICNYPLDQSHFQRAKERLMDNLLVSLERLENWEYIIFKRLINMGKKLPSLNNYIERRRKMLGKISFEEVVALRDKFLSSERLASVIVKSTKT